MKTLSWILILEAFILTYGLSLPNGQNRAQNMVPGVFIPDDAMNHIQSGATTNLDSRYKPQPGQRNVRIILPNQNGQNPPRDYSSASLSNQQSSHAQTNSQPAFTNLQRPVTSQQYSQQVFAKPQALTNIQQVELPQHPELPQQPANPQNMVLPKQSNLQANQPIILVPQPPDYLQSNNQPNQPLIFVQQPSGQQDQPIYLVEQPSQNQKPNAQLNQPIILVEQPNQNQQAALVSQSNQEPIYVEQPFEQLQRIVNPDNLGPIYTLVPLNEQTSNTNGIKWKLVPFQSESSDQENTGKLK